MTGEALAAPKPQNSRILLYAGLALGIVVAALVALTLSNASSESTGTVPATRIGVVAAKDIPARTRITADMLKAGTYKIEDIDSESFSAVSQLIDRVTATDISSGQIIVPSQVSDSKGKGLNFTVTPGMRAVSIDVKEVVTAGGNIVPGNHVDVIGIFEVPKEGDPNATAAFWLGEPYPFPTRAWGAKTRITVTMLQNVRVLAVAQSLPDSPEPNQVVGTANSPGTGSRPAANEKPNPKAATVTLEVSPQQAQLLSFGDHQGTLRMSVRSFGEDSRAQVTPNIIVIVD